MFPATIRYSIHGKETKRVHIPVYLDTYSHTQTDTHTHNTNPRKKEKKR